MHGRRGKRGAWHAWQQQMRPAALHDMAGGTGVTTSTYLDVGLALHPREAGAAACSLFACGLWLWVGWEGMSVWSFLLCLLRASVAEATTATDTTCNVAKPAGPTGCTPRPRCAAAIQGVNQASRTRERGFGVERPKELGPISFHNQPPASLQSCLNQGPQTHYTGTVRIGSSFPRSSESLGSQGLDWRTCSSSVFVFESPSP